MSNSNPERKLSAREKKNALQSNYKKMRRQKIKDYLGGKCVGCGATTNLQFDHIDRREKQFKIANNVTMAWDKLTAEADKCQLLCQTCHRIKSVVQHDCKSLMDGYKVVSTKKEGNRVIVTLEDVSQTE